MAEKTLTLNITGMHSDHSVDDVVRAVNTIPGLTSVDISADPGIAVVTFDDSQATVEDFNGAIKLAGYGATVA